MNEKQKGNIRQQSFEIYFLLQSGVIILPHNSIKKGDA